MIASWVTFFAGITAITACGKQSGQSSVLDQFEKDYTVRYELVRNLNDSLVIRDTCLIGRRDSLHILVTAKSFDFETATWSLSAIRASHLALYKKATTTQGYFFSSEDMSSVVRYAVENADSTHTNQENDLIATHHYIRSNGLGLKEVVILTAAKGTIRQVRSVYSLGSLSVLDVFHVDNTIASEDDIEEINLLASSISLVGLNEFVLRGPLAGYHLMPRHIEIDR